MNTLEKTCECCGKTKPVSRFVVDRRNPGVYSTACNSCRIVRDRKCMEDIHLDVEKALGDYDRMQEKECGKVTAFIHVNHITKMIQGNKENYPAIGEKSPQKISSTISTYLAHELNYSVWRRAKTVGGAIYKREVNHGESNIVQENGNACPAV